MELLLVEDNPADVRLVQEAFKDIEAKIQLSHVSDGEQALAYLEKKGAYADKVQPQLIFLDLNLPKISGKEVLKIIKSDKILRSIPVVILTSSMDRKEIKETYDLCANCFVTKPTALDQFLSVMEELAKFWIEIAKLPDPSIELKDK